MEKTEQHTRLHRPRNRHQHQQRPPPSDGVFADLTCIPSQISQAITEVTESEGLRAKRSRTIRSRTFFCRSFCSVDSVCSCPRSISVFECGPGCERVGLIAEHP